MKLSDIFNIKGDFPFVDGEVSENSNISFENEIFSLTSRLEEGENGVKVYTGSIKNLSAEDITLYSLRRRFTFSEGKYEVYSQYTQWENESIGGWQPLVTGLLLRNNSVRNSRDVTPFVALWNEQSGRGTVFHIISDPCWEVDIRRENTGMRVSVELGVNSENLAMTIKSGESVELPEIICYNAKNKADLDCYKIQNYINKKYPRREMPVVYNTWLANFDRITYENVSAQIPLAKSIGAEYFVIDAGWFGDGGDWYDCRGDWEENTKTALRGKMKDISDSVRASGMKFGFWIEAECASLKAQMPQKHPEYFIKTDHDYFLNFAREDAREYIFKTIADLVSKYNAEYIKFDFNDDLTTDLSHDAFTDYGVGYKKFLKRLRKEYPNLYLENCASGGTRMTLRDGKITDSYWSTDNQSVYDTMRMFKDTILRMPPQWIEKWVTIRTVKDCNPVYGSTELGEKIFSTHDAVWDATISVDKTYLKGFMQGSPIGISCDLTRLSEDTLCTLKENIADFKNERDFYKNAMCRILCDSGNVCVLEYFDENYDKVVIISYTLRLLQHDVTVYPYLDKKASYIKNGEKIKGEKLDDDGVNLPLTGNYRSDMVVLTKCK